MGVYLRVKFEISGIILTTVRQWGVGVILPPLYPTSKRTPKKPTRLGLRHLFQAVCGLVMKLLVIKNISRTLTLYFAMP